MFNLFQSLGYTVWKPTKLGSIHRLIHRNCGYPNDCPPVQNFRADRLNALHTKNFNLLQRGQQK